MILNTFDNQKYVISQYSKSQFTLFSFFLAKKKQGKTANCSTTFWLFANSTLHLLRKTTSHLPVQNLLRFTLYCFAKTSCTSLKLDYQFFYSKLYIFRQIIYYILYYQPFKINVLRLFEGRQNKMDLERYV